MEADKGFSGGREEVTSERFEARLRQDRIFEAMTPQEKALFRTGYVYQPVPSVSQDDPFVKCVNWCTTILLLVLLYVAIQYWNSGKSISLKDYL